MLQNPRGESAKTGAPHFAQTRRTLLTEVLNGAALCFVLIEILSEVTLGAQK
jgi:hypothetical protein